ncbi:MAG: histidinol-phosphate aminotransferase family protein [Nitrosarchaeum sp.]|nr:histidinol-phosphate aminotransferase family protein [Nitrosarchaeum sp.]
MRINPNISNHKRIKHGGPFSVSHPNIDILDFSSNISPTGTSSLVRKTIKNHLETIQIYPDSESIQLTKSLQHYTKIHSSQIVIGNGATEIIYNFCQAFLSVKTPVLIPIPIFGEYESAAKLSGAKVSFFKTMNLEKDIDGFISKLPNNGCVFICNPNNPTGNLIPKKTLKKIIASANKKKTLVFIDECFIELVPDYDESIIKLVKNCTNLFVLRSLTKSFALAGLRIGYGIGSKQMISILNKIKIPWNVSGLAQYAASTALSDLSYLNKVKKIIKKESFYLINRISKLNNFQCNTTSTNFILIKTKIKSKTLQKKLLEKKILIRDCSTIRGLNDNYIRIAVKTRKENDKLIKALEML